MIDEKGEEKERSDNEEIKGGRRKEKKQKSSKGNLLFIIWAPHLHQYTAADLSVCERQRDRAHTCVPATTPTTVQHHHLVAEVVFSHHS